MLGGLTTLFVIILMIYFAIDTFFEFQGHLTHTHIYTYIHIYKL